MNITDKEKIELLSIELKSIVVCINEYYENEDDDIPVDDILSAIMDDASELLQKLDLN